MDPYLARLEALPPVRRARLVDRRAATVAIETARRTSRLAVVRFDRRVTALMIAVLPTRPRGTQLVTAPVIAGQAARQLADRGINYVDLVGNCHLALSDEVFVHVEGKVGARAAPADRGIRAAGYQVLFTYLAGAEPRLPVRTVGGLAGVSRQAALEMRDRLRDDGYFVDDGRTVRWNPRRRDDALRRWLEGYQATVRPRLLAGTYRTRTTDPREVAAMVTAAAGPPGRRWRWGGSAAAHTLRHHYRGERTVIHVDDAALVDRLRALPDPRGNLVVLKNFGNRTPGPVDTCVHPLLAYSELLVGDDERAREAAADLLDALIRPTWQHDDLPRTAPRPS